jgi:hypothetical protein
LLNGSQPTGPGGREASSKTNRQVSWVEMARQDVQEQEASKSRVSSRMGSCQTTGFTSVTKDAASWEDLRARFSSVTEEAANKVDWRAVVVANPGWETKLLPGDGGWNASLIKREC